MKYANSGDAAVAELRCIRNYVTCLTVMIFLALFPFGAALFLFLWGAASLPGALD